MALAFALVATVTFASPAGEDDAVAMAAEKEYVTDPSTGKQVLKPEYGGTLTTVLWAGAPDHGDTWLGHPAGVVVGAALDKLGIADWTTDRSVSQFTTYWPESILRGHLAESWENPDPLTYIYTIRDNVFFHDKPPVNGRQLTADDMAANYERLLAIGRFAGQERSPVGNGTILIPMESVTATDELTFVDQAVAAVSGHASAAARRPATSMHVHPRPSTRSTTPTMSSAPGPLSWTSSSAASQSRLTGTPTTGRTTRRFPGNRLPYVDRLVMLMMGDEADQDCGAAVGSGRSHRGEWWCGVGSRRSASVLDLQKTNPGMQLFPSHSFRSEISTAINISAGGPLSDVRVRHALQMAIDLETHQGQLLHRASESGSRWDLSGQRGSAYHNAFDTWPEELKKFYSYDPEGAERLLDEAGYPRGADGVRFRTQSWQPASRSDVGYHELEVGYWKEIGVEVELNVIEDTLFFGKLSSGDWDGMAMYFSQGADYGVLDPILGAYTSEGPIGGAYCDPVFDARWEEVQAASDDEDEYRRLAKALDMHAIEQHVYIWGPRVPSFGVAQPWIVGSYGAGALRWGQAGWSLPYARTWIDSQLKAELN